MVCVLVVLLPHFFVESSSATSGDDVDPLLIGVFMCSFCGGVDSTWLFGLKWSDLKLMGDID